MRLVTLLVVSACGRSGFATVHDPDGGHDAVVTDGVASDGTAEVDSMAVARIAWVKTFVARYPGGGATDSFTAAAGSAGNAVALYVGCADTNSSPSAVTVTAPGWTFVPGGSITTNNRLSGALWFAIAPDTIPATVTVAWSGANCSLGTTEIGDEFTNNDPATTFDGARIASGVGNCTSTVMQMHADDAIWATCQSAGYSTVVGIGYTKAADDGAGNWAEFKITSSPAGSAQTPTFTTSGPDDFLSAAIAIKPR